MRAFLSFPWNLAPSQKGNRCLWAFHNLCSIRAGSGALLQCGNAENSPAQVALLIQVQADCVRNDRGHLSHSHFIPVIPPGARGRQIPRSLPPPAQPRAPPGSDPPTQLARLMKRSGLGAAEAEARISSQLPLDEKRKWATHVIDNSGDWESTRRQVLRLHARLEDSLDFLWARLAVGTAVAGLGGLVFLLLRHFIS